MKRIEVDTFAESQDQLSDGGDILFAGLRNQLVDWMHPETGTDAWNGKIAEHKLGHLAG